MFRPQKYILIITKLSSLDSGLAAAEVDLQLGESLGEIMNSIFSFCIRISIQIPFELIEKKYTGNGQFVALFFVMMSFVKYTCHGIMFLHFIAIHIL